MFPLRVSALFTIATQQLRAQVRTRRLIWAVATTVVLAVVAVLVRASDYADAHATRSEAAQGWLPRVVEQLQRDETVQVDNVRSMSPLVVISTGLEPVTPVRFASTKEGIRFGEGRGSSSIVDTLFGYLDLSFVVGTVVSLLTLTFAFDSVCGERRDGTLAVVLSYTGRRFAFYAGKIIAVSIAGALCVLAAIGAAVALHAVLGMPWAGSSAWIQLATAGICYVLVFAALGVWSSAASKEPADALVLCVSVWIALVYVAPRVVAAVVSLAVPPRGAALVALETEAAISKLKVTKAKADHRAYELYLASQARGEANEAELREAVTESSRALAVARRQLTDRLVEREAREDHLRDRYVRTMALFVPPVLFYEVTSEIARTGRSQRSRFYRDARIYDDEIGRRLVESRHVMQSDDGGGGVGRVAIVIDDVRPFAVPFETRWVPAEHVWNLWAKAVAAFLAMWALCALLGFRVMNSLDVRP